eukprot:GHRQ01032089.1.p2 GENE.GHRQ01032089.1~~GHRQ01032089.1.p2  ORF type:complete len:168 (-),score=41.16 GHRQ01032089.1:476-979(-)
MVKSAPACAPAFIVALELAELADSSGAAAGWLSTLQAETGALPRPGVSGDADKLLELVGSLAAKQTDKVELDEALLRKFASGAVRAGLWTFQLPWLVQRHPKVFEIHMHGITAAGCTWHHSCCCIRSAGPIRPALVCLLSMALLRRPQLMAHSCVTSANFMQGPVVS